MSFVVVGTLRRLSAVALAAWMATTGYAGAVGGKQDSTDWPCPQRKVTKLAASDLQWQGAAPDTIKNWRDDTAVAGIVKVLASRRTPADEAVKALNTYVETVPTADRDAKLAAVFSGLLETVNEYRSSVIDGIERFNKRQKARSSEIEAEGAKLSELQKAAEKDEKAKAEYEKALETYDWNTRVFEERRQNLPLACEIPPTIDGRTFELVREMQALIKQPG
jgi:hypothetical protein